MIGSFISAGVLRDHRPHDGRERRGAVLRSAADALRRDDRRRGAQRDDRAGRLPALARRAEARAADHRGRHLVHPAERRPAVARRLARSASPTSSTRSTRSSRSSGSRSRTRDLLAIGVTIPLLIVMTAFIAAPPGQGDARHRAGPRGRAADGHQRRHDDLADVPARRHAGRRGRPDLRAVPDDDLVLPGLHGRSDRLHRRGHGRHRQPPRRRARRSDHRLHPADLGQPHRLGRGRRRSCSPTWS